MRINHNIAALNTNRALAANNGATSKSLEKLSSGLRINRAGDDAAGLAISEKMRGQIRGLDMASKNAQDGISLIQTAEGALNETHSILQRMRELAVQSSTDTNTADDRTKLQSEIDQLAQEITRISNTTEFNTKNLLAGGFKSTFHIGANSQQNINLGIGALDAKTLGVAGDLLTTTVNTNTVGITNVTGVTEQLGADANIVVSAYEEATATVNQGGISGTVSVVDETAYTGSVDVSIQIRIATINNDATGDVTSIAYSRDGGTTWSAASGTGSFNIGDGLVVGIANDASNAVGNIATIDVTAGYSELQLRSDTTNIGSSVKVYSNQSSVTIGDPASGRTANVAFDYSTLSGVATAGSATITQTTTASTDAITDANGNVSTEAVVQKGINISTQSAADKAITTINNALETVSAERSKLGAVQNRLEHTINNLGAASENLTAAESRIRDVDMAKEMMEFTKNNILTQAAQAMLAQANQQPQGVLQLLR